MERHHTSILRILVLLGVSILIALFIAEYSLRFLYPQETLFPRYIDSPDFAIEFPRNSKLVHSRGSLWKFVYTTNELGRRGPYIRIQDEYETNNVVVLGDSFTFGNGVNDNEVYTSIMSELLNGDYAVVNGGMGGWGIDSEIKWYFKTGSQYQPKYVVLQFTANDTVDFTGVTRIENGDFVFYPNNSARPGWQVFLSSSRIIQNSHLYALLRDAYDTYRARDPYAAQQDGTPKVNEREASVDRKQVKYAEMLDLFASNLQDQGIELIFLSVTHRHEEAGIYHYDLDHFPYIDREVSRLESEGKLHYLDLPLEEMREHPGSPEGHQWFVGHHRLVGEEVAAKIKMLEKIRNRTSDDHASLKFK